MERAAAAVKAFNRITPQLTSYVRALLNDSSVKVAAGPFSHTDGHTVFIRPPMTLADKVDHKRAVCDVRGSDFQMECPACRQADEIYSMVFHEIAHIAYGSFTKEYVFDVTGSVREGARLHGTPEFYDFIDDRCETVSLKMRGKHDVNAVLSEIDPYLRILMFATEDARIDAYAAEARPGVGEMTFAATEVILNNGLELEDGSRSLWLDQKLDAQISVAILFELQGHDLAGRFDPRVSETMQWPPVARLLRRRLETQLDAVAMAAGALGELHKLGLYDLPVPAPPPPPMPSDAESDPDPEQGDPQPDPDNQDDSDPKPGEGSGEKQDPDQSEDNSDRTDESETPEEGDNDAENDSDPEDENGNDSGEPDGDSDDSGDDASDKSAGGSNSTDDSADEDKVDDSTGQGDQSDQPDESKSDSGQVEKDNSDGDNQGENSAEDQERSREDAGDSGSESEHGDSSDSDTDPDSNQDDSGSESDARNNSGNYPDQLDEHRNVDSHLPSEPEEQNQFSDIESADDLNTEAPKAPDFRNDDKSGSDAVKEALLGATGHREMEKAKELDKISSELLARAINQVEHFDDLTGNLGGFQIFREVGEGRGFGSPVGYEPIPESTLSGSIMRARAVFAKSSKDSRETALRSGKIDSRALGKRAWKGDDDRLFHRRNIAEGISYEVVIGLDISGSTGSGAIRLIKNSGEAMANVLNRIGIPFSLYAHTTGRNSTTDGIFQDIYEIKDVKDRWGSEQKTKLAGLAPCAGSLDGHNLQFYRKVLDRSKANNRLALYFTDGKIPATNHTEESLVMLQEIQKFERSGYKILGVGIGTDSPKDYGLDTVAISSGQDIITLVRALETRLVGKHRT